MDDVISKSNFKSAVTVPLNVPERLHLLSILPPEGDFTTLKIVRQMREMLTFTEAEHAEFGISQEQLPGGATTFNWKNAEAAMTPRPFEFQPKAHRIVAAALKKLDESKKLRNEHLSLFEAFVEE